MQKVPRSGVVVESKRKICKGQQKLCTAFVGNRMIHAGVPAKGVRLAALGARWGGNMAKM